MEANKKNDDMSLVKSYLCGRKTKPRRCSFHRYDHHETASETRAMGRVTYQKWLSSTKWGHRSRHPYTLTYAHYLTLTWHETIEA